ncbi:MAG: hypothetical protein ACR2MP_34660, partial [Streptosporangiaceae bacterium]
MNEGTGGRRRGKSRRMSPLAAALAGTAVLATACGGSHPAAADNSPGQLTAQTVDAFAQCMRSHGETNYYVYHAGSVRSSGSGSGSTVLLKLGEWVIPADLGSPQFHAAEMACRDLLPLHPLSGADEQAQLRALVKTAACMRAHGYPGYPDPTTQNGEMAPA